MTTPTPTSLLRSPLVRRLRAPRRAAALAVGLVVLGAPLVAQALADDPMTDAVVPVAAATAAVPTRAAALQQADAAIRTPVLDDRPDPTEMRRAERLEQADRDAEVRALLTATYAWNEQSPQVSELQALLEVNVDGRYGRDTRSAHLQVLRFAGLPTSGVPAEPVPAGTTAEQWASLRECESNGNYSIVSSGGTYRGAYQFNRSTWDSVAARHAPSLVGVDPAAASPVDQDAMAYALYGERGWQPWPTCGRHLG